MKYTSKRVYNPARKSRRIKQDMNQTGGLLGSKVTLYSANKRKPKKIINELKDLNKAKVDDENVSFKYEIEITTPTTTLTLKNIIGFRTAGWSNIKQIGANSMAPMIREIYDIPDEGTSFISRTKKRLGVDMHIDDVLIELSETIIKIPEKSLTGLGAYTDCVFTYNKIKSGDVEFDMAKLNDTEYTEEVFTTNVLNYFKKLNRQSVPNSAETAPGPGTGPVAGPVAGPGAVPNLTDIDASDVTNIKNIHGPDVLITADYYLITKTKLQKDVNGNYHGVETLFNGVDCTPVPP